MPMGPRNAKQWILAGALFIGVATLPYASFADRAQTLLGRNNISPLIRELIDESLGDAMGYNAIRAKVNDGQMQPDEGVQQMVKQAEVNVKDILNRLGVQGDNPAAKAVADAFVKARVTAKATSNIKLPVPKAAKASPEINFSRANHSADGKDPQLELEKRIEALEKKMTFSVDSGGGQLNRQRFDHEKPAIHFDAPGSRTPHIPGISGPKIPGNATHGPDVKHGVLPPGINEKVNPANTHSSVKKPVIPGTTTHPNVPDTQVPSSANPDINTKIPDAGSKISINDVQQKIQLGDLGQKVDPNVSPDLSDISQDVDGVNQKIDDIQTQVPGQKIGQVNTGVSADGIKQKINDAANLGDLSQEIKQKVSLKSLNEKAGFSLDEQGIRSKISAKLDPELNKVRDKVKAATSQAFSKVNGFMEGQISDKQKDYDAKKKAYDDIHIPSKKYHNVCTLHVVVCLKHKKVETSASIKARAKAEAKKKTAKGNMDAASKELQKYQQGYSKLKDNETSVSSNIDAVFSGATGAVDTASGDSDSAPEAPQDKKGRVITQTGDDRKIVEISGVVTENIVAAEAIAAAVGDETTAILNIGDIGGSDADTRIGTTNETIVAPGVISAAVGYESDSVVNIGNIEGTVGGAIARTITAGGVLAASIGAYSGAITEVANLRGNIMGSANQTITTVGALSASIGADTLAQVKIANMGTDGSAASLNQTITQITPAIAAAIGYDSEATISVGNIDADVAGSVDQTITIGNMISASIGSHTVARGRVGDINANVGGNLKQTITTGEVLNVAIGANTNAITDIGVIDAPVTGNVDMNVVIGDSNAVTVGSHTNAKTMISSVYAPVTGNLETDIVVGDINTFSIGLGIGSGSDISATTAVGSIFKPVTNPGKITVHTGSIVSLGFGIDIDLGILGELKIAYDGCEAGVHLGNQGKPC